MELKYSGSGTPYIDLDDGALIFSKITEDVERGYKFLVFNGRQVNSVCVSGAKAKNKKYSKIVEDVGFTIDMNFKRKASGKEYGIPNDARFCFSKISEKILKKMFDDLVVDGYFPRENVSKLGQMLRERFSDDTDTWDDDPTATESYDDIGEKKEKSVKKKIKMTKKPRRKLTMAKKKSIIKGKK